MKRLLLLLAVLVCISNSATANEYHINGQILSIDYIRDRFQIVLENGHIYELSDIQDWWILDYVEATMEDCNTADPTDDIVLSLRYLGNEQD